MSETLKIALTWLSKGIAPIPILYQDKKPAIQWREFQKRLPSETEVRKWFSTRHNLAIITGWNNLVVIDFDDFQTYNDWQVKTNLITYSVLTSRGVHCYFYIDEIVNNQKLPSIDIKGRWGLCTVPPSIHPSGIVYTALDPDAPILSVTSLDKILDIPKPPQTDTEWTGIDRSRVDIWYDNDLVGAIKTRYEILDFLQGVKLSGRGWFMAHCPFHDDKNPSFWIDSNRGLCGCFAGCTDKAMDVIDLFARLQGVSNEEAIYEMGEKIGWYEEWA